MTSSRRASAASSAATPARLTPLSPDAARAWFWCPAWRISGASSSRPEREAPPAAGWILRQIGLLYRIEAGLREAGSGPSLRQRRRAAESAMPYRRPAKALLRMRQSGRFLPSSAMAKALDYALSNWAATALWIEDGCLEIDNNLVENAIRPTALGKKNWLFMGCAQAGETGAILFAIVQSCRRWQIDPFEYLRDVLDRIPGMTNHRVAELTPRAWADARKPRQAPRAMHRVTPSSS